MPANEKKDFFSVLSAIDCSKLVQKRNALDYLPWATTWKLLKQHDIAFTRKQYMNAQMRQMQRSMDRLGDYIGNIQ